MSDDLPASIPALVDDAKQGDASAVERLFAVVYDELREIAHTQRRGWDNAQTLNTTALVHEAYLKLIGHDSAQWKNRAHFLAVAATAMRQILIDYARSQRTAKRGGEWRKVSLEDVQAALTDGPAFGETQAEALIALNASLERLSLHSDRLGRIVECRYFGGMSIPDTAEALGVSPATVKRGWSMAQAWLYRELRETL